MKATTGAIWEAASSDDSRPVLNHVQFDAVAGTLMATNSYIAASVPCEVEEGDESGLIPAVALKEAKGRSLAIRDGRATLKLSDGTRTWDLLTDGQFPDMASIFEKYELIEFPFGVNPELMLSCARALGCGGKSYAPLVLHPSSPLKGIRVTSQRGGDGILMPVRLEHQGVFQPTPDLTDPDVLLAGVHAAQRALAGRKGKRKAAEAFHAAALRTTVEAAGT